MRRADRGIDFVVRSPDNRALLVVEAKNRLNTSADWAAKLRRNLAAQGALPDAPYFLLALPDRFYLWTQQSASLQAVPADYVFEAETVLRPYLDSLKSPLHDLSPASFELLVRLWLEDLVRDGDQEHPRWLHSSGLEEQLRDAVVTSQAA